MTSDHLPSQPARTDGLPFLRHTSTGSELIVDGKPFLLLGGQLHNSSPSSASYMAPIWDRLASMGVTGVIGSASWELVEPEEGRFDFTHVDAQVSAAHQRGIRLVLIWFGAFKNATSTYAPRWVRQDTGRFSRAVLEPRVRPAFTYSGAMPKPVLSVFSSALLDAERRAFISLMRHLAETDPAHTVVAVQVDNEVGVLGDSRDRSSGANSAWAEPVPSALIEHLAAGAPQIRPELVELWDERGRLRGGTWGEVFGDDWRAEEVFMAWGFARHVDALATAGKAVKALPMYVNAWLGPQPGQSVAGQWPSGGPASRVLDVWKAGAPAIDMLAPDVYLSDAKPALGDYARPDNPLFVPEAALLTGTLFWALGHHRALGFSVFGIEDVREDSRLSRAYGLLAPMTDLITSAQAEGRIAGILLEAGEAQTSIELAGYQIVAHSTQQLLEGMLLDVGLTPPPPPVAPPSETDRPGVHAMPTDLRPFGILIAEAPDEFLLVGQGLSLDFTRRDAVVEVDHVEEGRVEDGTWVPGRTLNGDERHFLVPDDDVAAVRLRLLRGPLPSL